MWGKNSVGACDTVFSEVLKKEKKKKRGTGAM